MWDEGTHLAQSCHRFSVALATNEPPEFRLGRDLCENSHWFGPIVSAIDWTCISDGVAWALNYPFIASQDITKPPEFCRGCNRRAQVVLIDLMLTMTSIRQEDTAYGS